MKSRSSRVGYAVVIFVFLSMIMVVIDTTLRYSLNMPLAAVGELITEQYKVVSLGYETLRVGCTSERWADKTTDLPMKR